MSNNTNMEAQTTENTFASFLNVCGVCRENLKGRDAKLLPCLHTFCKACLLESAGENTKVRCPTCHTEYGLHEMVNNQFVAEDNQSNPEATLNSTDEKKCTACEENQDATSYCVDCSEYLCNQCVQAHKRVRVTKDHTIQPKDSVVNSESASSEKLLFCPLHKQELLKLFCETCDKLTCRDCQLLEHKEHKYQFVHEASQQYKLFLQTLCGKLKEKRTYIENAKTLINRRYSEISEKEKVVTNDIKTFAIRLITEINRRGKKLLTNLNAVCGAKKRQLGLKHNEILSLSMKLDHALKFSEYALEHGNNTAVLFTKKMMINQLKDVLRTRCEVPNPYHVIDIRLKYDEQFILNQLSRQGALIVDGVPYLGPAQGSGGIPPGSNNSQQQGSMSPSTAIRNPNFTNLTPEQKSMLMKRLAHMAQSGQRSVMGNQSVQQGAMSPTSSLRSMVGSGSGPLSHYPPAQQSSMVSSSNNHPGRNGANQYFPGSAQGNRMRMTGNNQMINLHTLQQARIQRHQQNISTNFQNPIVIEPTSPASYPSTSQQSPLYSGASGSPSSAVGKSISPLGTHAPIEVSPIVSLDQQLGETNSFSRQSSTDSKPTSSMGSNYKQEERASCGFAGQSLKQESSNVNTGDNNQHLSMNPVDLNFDADPESFLESIKKEAESLSAVPSTVPTPIEIGANLGQDTPLSVGAESTLEMPFGDYSTLPESDIQEGISQQQGSNASSQADAQKSSGSESAPQSNTERSKTPNGDQEEADEVHQRAESDRPPEANNNVDEGNREMSVSQQSSQPCDDPSEDYCACCHNGGNLLCCDFCPKVFHFECHVPIIKESPNEGDTWQCGLCRDMSVLRLPSQDLDRQSPGPSGTKRRWQNKLTPKELKVCERVLLELFSIDASTPFHEAVPKTVPAYYKIITNPMDLGKIKRKLGENNGECYHNMEEFLADILLVLANCALYNEAGSEVAKMGLTVEKRFTELVGHLLPYIDLQTVSPTRSSTPGSDTSEKQKTKKKKKNEEPAPQHFT